MSRSGLLSPRVVVVGIVVVCAMVAVACSETAPEALREQYGDPTIGAPGLPTPPLGDGPGADGRDTSTMIDCPFDTSAVGPVTCGRVAVPSRGDASGDITLTYARFGSTAPPGDRRDDPVIYLHGGPGGEIVAFADLVAPVVVDPFIDHRDVILYDQRGSGLSSALPPCSRAWDLEPEYYEAATGHEQLAPRYAELISGCGTSLGIITDIDLHTYNSAVHADDLVDLRRALGITTYNLYGSSYGSRLAQTVMRDHPDDVRTVTMSGVYPIEVNLIGSTPATFRDALDTVFASCTATPRCAEALPDPWAAVQAAVDGLDAEPIVTTFPLDSSEALDLVIAGDDLVNSLHAALYRRDSAAMIPDLLIDLGDGDTSRLERLARDTVADISHVAPYLTVQCREEAPFTTVEAVDAAHTGIDAVDRIDLPPGLLGSELIEICATWDVGPIDATENEPTTWTQPTLLFSGGFDPITPPRWAADLADRLPDARLVHSSDLGHDSDESRCAQRIMADFVENPDAPVSAGCADRADQVDLDDRALRWVAENAPALTSATIDLSPGGGPAALDIVVPDWLRGFDDGDLRVWWRDLDTYDLAAVIIAPRILGPPDLEPYVDVEDASVEFDPATSARPGWLRTTATTAGMDIVVHQRTSPSAVSVALVAYDDDLDELERRVLDEVVDSIDEG